MKRLILTGSMVLLAFLSAPTPAGGQNGEPIIDMHMHAHLPPYPPGKPSLCRPEPCDGQGSATATHGESLEKTLDYMTRYNVVKGFLSGDDLDVVDRWVEAGGDRFIASVFIIDPDHFDPEQLRREYETGRLDGMGEIATQLTGIPPDDPRLEPLFAVAEDLDVPVLIHSAGIGPYLPTFRSAVGSPLRLEEVLVRHPNLRIYVENAGYPYRDDMIAMMYQYPQLYADISTITWVIPRTAFYDYLKSFVKAGLAKRLMFGSDQMRWPEVIERGIEAIEEAEFLTDQQRRDIFYNNAARFLRLEPAGAGTDN